MKTNIRLTVVTVLAACTALRAMPGTAHAQSPTPMPGDLFASINGPVHQGGSASIYRYTPGGMLTVVASTLYSPRGLVFDNAGNLFVASNDSSSGNYQATILKITPDGFPSTYATGFPNNFFLSGLVRDSAGNLFVMAQNMNDPSSASTIYEVTPDGTPSPFGLQSPCSEQRTDIDCSTPGQSLGLAFDSVGNLYAADGLDSTVFIFTSGGSRTIFAGPDKFPSGGPQGLAFDSFGNLFVSAIDEPGNSTILEFAPDRTVIASFTGMPTNAGARGLAFDATGNLFVAEVGFNGGGSGAIQEFPLVGSSPTPSASPTPIPFASGIGADSNRGPEYLAFKPGSNTTTSAGQNVTTNAGTVGFATISLTFPRVTSDGTTTVTPVDPSSAGYTLPGSSLAFDITTTAAYPTPVPTPPGIVIAFRVARPLDVLQLTVYHNENGLLVPVTCPSPNPGPTPDLTTNTIYASVTSLSPFVIAKVPFAAHVQQPINSDGSSIFNANRGVVPVKFTLTQDGTPTCTLPTAIIAVTRTAGGTIGAIDESVYSGAADTGSNFRSSGCQYVYNLNSGALGVGTYRVDIKIGGIVVGSAGFGLK